MSGELADDIRSAMEEAEATAVADSPATDAPAPSEPTATEPADSGNARDTSGRFAPRTPAEPLSADKQPPAEVPVDGQQPAPAEQPAQQAYKAPASWKPAAREDWAKAPPSIQAEVARREREITDTLRNTAEARHFHQEFNTAISSFEQNIRAAGVSPIQAVQSLFTTEHKLRNGDTGTKAGALVDLIMSYGVDIEALDSALLARTQGRGVPQPQAQQIQQPMRDPRLDPILERFERQEQAALAALEDETTEFLNNPAMEFAWDVKDDMADILDLAAKRNQKITLQDAYNRAIMLHPEVSEIVQRRKTVNTAASTSEAAQRAKRAAASIADNGAPSRASEGDDSDDLRSAISASMRSLNSRR